MTTWLNNARLALPAFAVVIAVFVFFHDKAYTIDDPFFLLQADQVLKDPLNPSGFEIVWGPQLGRASEVSLRPALEWRTSSRRRSLSARKSGSAI